MEQQPSLVRIMREGSTTFSNSTLFFPGPIRRDVVALYAFVRVADDFVDSQPQDGAGLRSFMESYRKRLQGQPSKNRVVEEFVDMAQRRGIPQDWVESFFQAMEQDLTRGTYTTLAETESYIYGSAEVVGMMMARILDLPDSAMPYARLLGKAFQYINFIRDIREDLDLGRTYLPQEHLRSSGLPDLSYETATQNAVAFRTLIRNEIALYRQWRDQAVVGFSQIPWRNRVAIQTATDLFDRTARTIEQDPLVVFRRKVKPTKTAVLITGIRNLIPKSSLFGRPRGACQGG